MASSGVYDMTRKKVLIPGYEPPELTHTECAHCGQDIDVKTVDVDAVPDGIDIHVLCVECIPPYLAGAAVPETNCACPYPHCEH